MNILFIPAELIDPLDQLSSGTQCRCEAGLIEWQRGEYDLLLLAGGVFLSEDRQTRPAAEIMKDWFVERGVSPTSILVETRSVDTYQNIAFGLELLMGVCPHAQITVLTQYQHAIRFLLTSLLAHRVRIKVVMIRDPDMSWTQWLLEWIVLIPCHLIDWRGIFFLAQLNRARRQAAAQRAAPRPS